MSERETAADKCPSQKPPRTNVQPRNVYGQMSERETVADKCPSEESPRTNVQPRNGHGQMSERETAVDICPGAILAKSVVRLARPVAVEHGQCHQAASRSIASLQLNAFAEILALSTPRHSRRCSAPAGVSPGQLVTMNPGFSRVRIAPG